MICDGNTKQMFNCHAFNNGECMNTFSCGGNVIKGVEIIHNRVNYDSDPTAYHCQHKIAEMNNYTYCPECGKLYDKR